MRKGFTGMKWLTAAIVLLALVLCFAVAGADGKPQIQVTLNQASYRVGDTLTISYTISGASPETWKTANLRIEGYRTQTSGETWYYIGTQKTLYSRDLTSATGTCSYTIQEHDGVKLRYVLYVKDEQSNYADGEITVTDAVNPASPVFTISLDKTSPKPGEMITVTYDVTGGSERITRLAYDVYYGLPREGRWSDEYDWTDLDASSGTFACGPVPDREDVQIMILAESETGWGFAGGKSVGINHSSTSEETRITVEAGTWVGKDGAWKLVDADGTEITSMKDITCLEIPAEVAQINYKIFGYTTKDFYIKCTPGSAGEAFALKFGLQYDNGVRRVIGKDITSVYEKVRWIVANYVTPGMSEKRKARVLHDWLVYNADYDSTLTRSGASGVLIEGAGVCNSYTLAYQMLLNEAGIENTTLTGLPSMNHIWNLVRIGGKWYHVDVTWDDSAMIGTQGTFFLLNDQRMGRDHFWDSSISADKNMVGFVEFQGEKYYYGGGTGRYTGLLKLESSDSRKPYALFYFDRDGKMQKGIQSVDGETYCFDEYQGAKMNEWGHSNSGDLYYFGEDCAALTGWQSLKDTWGEEGTFYFHEDGKAAEKRTSVGDKLYLFFRGKLMGMPGWYRARLNEDYYNIYCYEDLSIATGWVEIPDLEATRLYCLNELGDIQQGWQTRDGNWYYFAPYALANTTKYLEKDGVWHYFDFDETGKMIRCYDAPEEEPRDPESQETPETPEIPETSTVEDGGLYILGGPGGTAVFSGTADPDAESLTIRDSVIISGVTYEVTTIAEGACSNRTSLKTVTIAGGITKIEKNAFSGCSALKTLKGGDGVSVIGDGAFSGCGKLKKLPSFPKLKTIGASAFEKCKSLTKITLGKNVKKIGEKAFYKCAKLKSIVIQTTKLKDSSVGKNAFKGIYKSAEFQCPKNKQDAYRKILEKKGAPKKATYK